MTVVALTYALAAALRRLPPEVSPHPSAFFPSPQQLLPGAIFFVSLIWYRRRLSEEDSAFDRTIYAAAWFNVAAFQMNAFGTFGNLVRATLTGPGVFTIDFSALKNFNFGGGKHIQLRIEAFREPANNFDANDFAARAARKQTKFAMLPPLTSSPPQSTG